MARIVVDADRASSGGTAAPAAFPFSAVVGQDRLKLALVLCAIAPEIGGVLIRGEKGTAKSTIVRALAPLLPTRLAGTPARVVDLPIGATEDRVVGSLDVASVLRDGETAFTPGLLADAHEGVLYIDEVNLLADHLVDVLLDAAAMGRVTVERDAISRTYQSRFVLVGTMNPEEGELRPQLLDRFGLSVPVAAPTDVEDRVEVITRRMAYDADPESFAAQWLRDDRAIAGAITAARMQITTVTTSHRELRRIAAACTHLDVDGLRADIVVARTARAHAAWRGASAVAEEDVRVAIELAVAHRRRRDPFDSGELSDDDLDNAMAAGDDAAQQTPPDDPSGPTGSNDGPDDDGPDDGGPDDGGPGDGGPDTDGPGRGSGPSDRSHGRGPSSAQHDPGPAGSSSAFDDAAMHGTSERGVARESAPRAGDASDAALVTPQPGAVAFEQRRERLQTRTARALRAQGTGDGDPGRRSLARSRRGHTIGAVNYNGTGLHVHETVMAAVASATVAGAPRIAGEHLRSPIRMGREGNLVVFCVDLSGSMTARKRLESVAGACAALLRDSYQRRDRVAVIAMRGSAGEVVVPPTRSALIALQRLTAVSVGGRTPLAEGLEQATTLIERARRTDPRRRPLLVVITDGRATSGRDAPARAATAADRLRTRKVDSVVIDCEHGMIRLGLARTLATHLGARHLAVDAVSVDTVTSAVRAAA